MSCHLPNFLMIGVPRSGSTWLYTVLRVHPEIYLSPALKESHFFSGAADVTVRDLQAVNISYRLTHDLDEYQQLFASAEGFPLRGEIDPSILGCARYAIPKIRELIGECQFLIVLRQPAERAYSHYLLHARFYGEPHPFEYYLHLDTPRDAYERIALHRYFRCSYYYEDVKLFFDAFGRRAFCVVLYDDLADADAFLQTILQFLHAAPFALPDLSERINAGIVPAGILAPLRRPQHPLRQFARRYLPTAWRKPLRRAWQRNRAASGGWSKPPLGSAIRQALTERYREDILQLQDLIQRDLGHWLV